MRILFGALAIFAVGMVVVTIFRRGKARVTEVVTGSGPLTIPLPFVPFELDGNRLGKLERLVVNREAPKKVSSVDLEVKLDDSLVAQGLAGCRLAANLESDSAKAGDVNVHVGPKGQHAFFFCATSDSALVPFGTVTLLPGEVTVPLLVPTTLAETLRSGKWAEHEDSSSDVLAERAESLADHAEEVADSIATENEQRAEAMQAVHTRLGDSLRAVGLRRADSLKRALEHVAEPPTPR
ncbi:MAG TPA: hypothetical protein VMY76_02450 [Gemmatimonadales bacterium]|nr:hypothetical protein [Gemmatimonadales bacterium]